MMQVAQDSIAYKNIINKLGHSKRNKDQFQKIKIKNKDLK